MVRGFPKERGYVGCHMVSIMHLLQKWLKSGTKSIRFFKKVIILLGLLLLAEVSSSLITAIAFYNQFLSALLIVISLVICFIVVIATPVMLFVQSQLSGLRVKRLNGIIWRTGIVCSIFVLAVNMGLFCFGFTNITGLTGLVRAHSTQTEFPLGGLRGIAVDSSGRVYLALDAYQRIQVYDSQGNFVEGRLITAASGTFNIWIDAHDYLHAVIARKHLHQVFDLKGQLLKSTPIMSSQEEIQLFKTAGGLQGTDAFGNSYLLQKTSWHSKVLKSTPKDETIIFVEDSFPELLLRTPQPNLMLGLTAFIMTIILARVIKKNMLFSN
jgi:hypothetical protein